MPAVKKIICGATLTLAAVLALALAAPSPAPTPDLTPIPARADLAEAVFAMIAARATEAGLPQPTTLCEACPAAHLDLPAESMRERCRKACGLR
jgi:hypothetical protein